MPEGDTENRVTISVTIPRSLKRQLKEVAKHENNSVSRIVENGLRPFISAHPLYRDKAASGSPT